MTVNENMAATTRNGDVDCDSTKRNNKSVVAVLEGPIIRKKKRGKGWLVVNVLDERINSVSTSVWIQTRTQDNESAATTELFFVQAVVQVTAILIEDNDTKKWIGQSSKLIQCAPNPKAIPLVWKGIVELKMYSPSTLLISNEEYENYLTSTHQQQEGEEKLSLLPLPIVTIVERIQNSRRSDGEGDSNTTTQKKGPRRRSPHVRRRDMRLLDHLEQLGSSTTRQQQQQWKLVEPHYVPTSLDPQDYPYSYKYCQTTTNNQSNLESHPQRRLDYMTGKKHPQISWMIQRLWQVNNGVAPRHILDVGGGRGDLAIALALAFAPCDEDSGSGTTRITIVDKNTTSLEAGQEYAQKVLGPDECTRRLRFVNADFGELMSQQQSRQHNDDVDDAFDLVTVDWVVALHACGDLSDLALKFAQTYSCSFLLCPCCYTKRYCFTAQSPPPWTLFASSPLHTGESNEQQQVTAEHQIDADTDGKASEMDPSTTLGRLAELSEAPEVSKRAMTIVNSMRLAGCKSKCTLQEEEDNGPPAAYSMLRLEEYDSKCSGRNIVMIGAR